MPESLKISLQRFLPKGGIARGVRSMAGGTALVQIILVLAMLLLARPYSSRKSSAAHALYRMCGSLDNFSHRSRVCLITITLRVRASLKSDR